MMGTDVLLLGNGKEETKNNGFQVNLGLFFSLTSTNHQAVSSSAILASHWIIKGQPLSSEPILKCAAFRIYFHRNERKPG